MPLPELLSAQEVKQYRRRRVVRVRHRVVFGTLAKVTQMLAQAGWQINPAFIERVNLSIRQHVAAVGRRVITLGKHEAGLRQHLALYHTYDNVCLPHASLRLPQPHPLPTNGRGSEDLAALYTGDGCRTDRACVDVASRVGVSRATMATATGAVSHGFRGASLAEWTRCAHGKGKKAQPGSVVPVAETMMGWFTPCWRLQTGSAE
jgi:hypothetical protein